MILKINCNGKKIILEYLGAWIYCEYNRAVIGISIGKSYLW